MEWVDQLRSRVRQESFYPRRLGLICNPSYIVRRALWKTIAEFAPRISGEVLDFGCGSKPYERLFTNAQRYTGVDVEVSGHQHADSKIDVYYDGNTLPFSDSTFDAVVAFEVLEHIFNIDRIVAEIARVMKPGGRLLISVPFAWEEHEAPYDFARYTTFGMAHLLARHGFAVVESRKTTTTVLAIWQLFLAYLERIGPQRGALRHIYQAGIIGPTIVAGYLVNAIAPRRYDFFCNTVVLATKESSNAGDKPARAPVVP